MIKFLPIIMHPLKNCESVLHYEKIMYFITVFYYCSTVAVLY